MFAVFHLSEQDCYFKIVNIPPAVAVQENENLMEELKQKIPETVFVEEELLKTKAEHEAMIHSLKTNAEMDCEK